MHLRRTIGEKGQLVIPKDIREYLGLKPGVEVVFEVREGEVVLRAKKDPKEFVEDFCSVPRKIKRKVDLERLLEKQVEEEYEIH